MNRETIKEILQNEGILPQSKFGQNFLCDEEIISSIVELCEIGREDRVLEIGPGLGSLTYPLSELTSNLTCVEIDHGLAEYLSDNITNARIINADFIKAKDLGFFDVVVSNIPYYVMTDIMKKLFGEFPKARKMVFMVEDEAIARIDCGPNTKQYGPLAILCSLYGSYTYEFKVPHTAFVPQPRTTSAVISFRREDTADILSPGFVKFLNTCFAMRRKMLKKNLSQMFAADVIDEAFRSVGISENARAEELEPETFSCLYAALKK
ncbi:16S rRNA (adenine(1518)-N(6)/adenine(1519)-N(6))-dimethyltransferase RsmA [Butyrivibrio sp. AE2032]|uniref:16S rRNA (adenine(1518)-N(6)/adenine(1519)-N(6))- dimethyltransferase RsmA n=1 Tax=Butyrivibrio sp. AE2032 TaxID=1458463 RepID=UPI000690BF1D|nr:16S rRNA (adenine(1518)-N(6)/adenine(1519)-N(6))-dimethyltransferase RsmA [Butyrivibrio sp. AE2032]